jgi:TM2 domain-containing membrane protein YozV
MSEFKISCPNCEQHLLCNDSYRGVHFPCPNCGMTIAVPPAADSARIGGLRIAAAAPASVAPAEPRPHIPPRPHVQSGPSRKSWLRTVLFAWFLGGFGVDRFYNGRIGLGVMKLATFGGCGWWTLVDIGFLARGTYKDGRGQTIRAESPRQKWITIGSLCAWTLVSWLVFRLVIPEQGVTATFGFGHAALSQGFASPEAVFEAMKKNPPDTSSDLISVLPPGEQYGLAYLSFLTARMAVNFQTDARKKQEAEKDFTTLIEKYRLADKLEFSTGGSEEQVKDMAAKAFADVDLTAFMDEVETFDKKYESETFKIIGASDDPKMVSLKDLKIEGDEANGTVLYSNDTEKPIVFVKSGGGWFYSMERSEKKSGGDDTVLGGGRDGLVLVVTFDSEASMKRTTKERLLQGVAYDRSQPATLEAVASSPREALLSFALPASADKEAIIRTIRRSAGVTKVDNLSDEKMKALVAAKLEEAFNKTSFDAGTRLPNGGVRGQQRIQPGEAKGIHNWESIRKGVSQEQVRSLLGEPVGQGQWSQGPTWDYAPTNSTDHASSGKLRIYFDSRGNVTAKGKVF